MRRVLIFTPPDQSKRFANTTPKYDASTLPSGGLLDVSYPNYAQPFSTWWAKGAAAVGMDVIKGFTSGKLINGSSWFVNTINHANGFRESSETAFLRPFLGRKNLVLYTNTLAEKILFDGTVAEGVRASSKDASITLIGSTGHFVVRSVSIAASAPSIRGWAICVTRTAQNQTCRGSP